MLDNGTIGFAAPRGVLPPAHSLGDTRFARLGFVSDAERAVLNRVPVTVKELKAGGELIAEGSRPGTVYYLQDGWAYRYMTKLDGACQASALLVPGGICNLDNLLFERADFGVRAITPITVLALARERALALAAENPGISGAFTWAALAENAILSQWALGLGRRTALQRLAHLLCELSIRLAGGHDAENCFALPMTQEMIANVLGLTAVHVNRNMQSLRGQGLISTAVRTVTILDRARLETLAEFNPSYLHQIEKSAASRSVEAA